MQTSFDKTCQSLQLCDHWIKPVILCFKTLIRTSQTLERKKCSETKKKKKEKKKHNKLICNLIKLLKLGKMKRHLWVCMCQKETKKICTILEHCASYCKVHRLSKHFFIWCIRYAYCLKQTSDWPITCQQLKGLRHVEIVR